MSSLSQASFVSEEDNFPGVMGAKENASSESEVKRPTQPVA
jgi:hypothetical protein